MSIDVLGKSLLAAAKKKTKQRNLLGGVAAAGLVGITGANYFIRKKAIERAEQFNNSIIPIKKKLDGEFNTIAKAETDFNTREAYVGGARMSFIDDEKTTLKKVISSGTRTNLNADELHKVATEESQDEYDAYLQKIETYKEYFGMKSEEYYKHYNKLSKEGDLEIRSDNLGQTMGRWLGTSDQGRMIQTKIKLSDEKEMDLALPQRLLQDLDVPFLKEINNIETRKVSANSVETSQKLYIEDGEVNILIERLTNPTPPKAIKVDQDGIKAWEEITEPNLKNGTSNPFYMGGVLFTAPQQDGNLVTSDVLIFDLKKTLSKTVNGQPLDVTRMAENQQSDWDKIKQETFKIYAGKKAFHVGSEETAGEPITDELIRQWTAESLRAAISSKVVLDIETKAGFFGGKKDIQVPKLRVSEVEGGQKTSEETIGDSFINIMGASINTPSGQEQLLKLIKQNPSESDKLTPYIIDNKTRVETLENIITVDNLENVNIVVGKAADGSNINWSDRPIINKIIEVESSGRINAMSDHGAKGLMQIKDATADKPGMGVPPAVRDKAGNISAEENVIFGTNYFDALTERYNGDLVTATMAYNAGMGTIDKWIKEGRNYNDLRTETQNYVGKIFGKDIQELVKAGTYGQDIIQTPLETSVTSSPSLLESVKEEVETKVEPVVTSSLLAPRDLSNRLSSEEMDRRMNEGVKRMGENSVSLGELLGMDKESTKKRVIKKAEKYLNNEISNFSSSIFSKWVKETKGIEAYKIKKEDKPEVVEEFLDFLNQ